MILISNMETQKFHPNKVSMQVDHSEPSFLLVILLNLDIQRKDSIVYDFFRILQSVICESYFSIYIDLKAQPAEMRVQNDKFASKLCMDGTFVFPYSRNNDGKTSSSMNISGTVI